MVLEKEKKRKKEQIVDEMLFMNKKEKINPSCMKVVPLADEDLIREK